MIDNERGGLNADRLMTLGQQIIVARQAGHDVAGLAQAWSDALRKATVARHITGEQLDELTDFEYAVWGHPAAEQLAVIGAALDEAFRRGDTQQAKELYRQRVEVLQQHATWYQVANQPAHT